MNEFRLLMRHHRSHRGFFIHNEIAGNAYALPY
jgi:hypothetical protein